jgi:uncharacterized lipoprotein YehR (DUF1307 family)
MKRMRNVFSMAVALMIIIAGCGKNNDTMSNEEKISGKDSKTWKATRETNAAGEKDKLTRQEKKQSITFNRNGTVKMSDAEQVVGGTWSYTDNTLSLQFTGTNVTESFTVLELDKDKIRLLAEDGGSLTLEPD